jgi:hypothetical protein
MELVKVTICLQLRVETIQNFVDLLHLDALVGCLLTALHDAGVQRLDHFFVHLFHLSFLSFGFI